MAINQLSLTAATRESSTTHYRTLGTIGMLCGPALFIEGMLYSLGYAEGARARFIPLLGIIYLAGWACSLAGMRQLRATGRGTFARVLFIVQLAGLALALLFNVQEMLGSSADTLFFRVTDMAWPASHVLMLATAILVLASGVWRGWRGVPPFVCGLALPTFFAASAVVGREWAGPLFGALTAIGFVALGLAVRTSERPSA